ncbi:ABC-three component system middle component 1 [Pelosinus sp. sgz500959]|uniref:ABC-three component system middle component 1 n=1 Tax=Pelosinus sp. sgz500959 TaxID=3242472 RepID=UPI00366FCCA1
MKFDRIKSKIRDMINDRFEFEDNAIFESELLSLADENLKNKGILRIKRLGIKVDSWKTLALVEIEADDENDIKVELKKAISWLAAVKEFLLGTESTDLYLFLAFNGEVCIEECLRIESTEQFCRKYVLLPGEEISEFVNRTFLQKLINSGATIDGEDPLERAFSETAAKYKWLTPEIQKTWKKAFSDLSGSELVDALLKEEELV